MLGVRIAVFELITVNIPYCSSPAVATGGIMISKLTLTTHSNQQFDFTTFSC